MTLQQSVHAILYPMETSVLQLSDQQYCQKITTLSGASIGQHVRHTAEMFICLELGYQTGIVNYEKRKRDILLEVSREKAIETLRQIRKGVQPKNKDLLLNAGYDEKSDAVFSFSTNYFREIAYNLEHVIHHMALIKIGISEVSDLQLPEGYGVAPSTLKYRNTITEK